MAEQPPQDPAALAAAAGIAVPDPALAAAAAGGAPGATPLGATITQVYAKRTVKVFGVLESEMHALAMFNTLSMTYLSVASALLSFGVGILTNAMFAEKITAAGEVALKVATPVLMVLSAVFFLLAKWALERRGSTWDEIKKESASNQG